jgi:hypothetical protein
LKHSEITHLSLEDLSIGGEGLEALTRLLQYRNAAGKRIKSLGLVGSTIFPRCIKRTSEEIKKCTYKNAWKNFVSIACQTLESLDLSNGLCSAPCCIAHLANAISSGQNACTLMALILSNNSIGDSGLKTLCNALKKNRTIILLACGECGLSPNSIPFLTDAVRCNPKLERLYLYGNCDETFDTNTMDDSFPLMYWIKLNSKGRALFQSEDCNPRFLPFVLGRVSKQPSILYGLLHESPHTWNS